MAELDTELDFSTVSFSKGFPNNFSNQILSTGVHQEKRFWANVQVTFFFGEVFYPNFVVKRNNLRVTNIEKGQLYVYFY